MGGGIAAWLMAPFGNGTAVRRRWYLAGLLWLLLVGMAVGPHLLPLFQQSDVFWYRKLALGEHDVMQPFSARQLAPLLVRGLVHVSGVSLETGFIVLGVISYAVFAAALLWLLLEPETPRWTVLAVACMSFWPFTFNSLAFPDLLFSALTTIFLLLLRERYDLAAALMLFPLTLSREATLLTLACLLVAAWRRMRWRYLALACVALALGSAVVKHLARGETGNLQRMPPAIYMVGKLPWNAMRNLTGIDPYTNLAGCRFPVPLWQRPFHFRGVEAIGVCEVESLSPRFTYGELTAAFGILPVLMLWLWRRRAVPWREQTVLLRFCLLYGAISFLLAPGLGTAIGRLVRYAWPLFLVALPELARQLQSRGQASPSTGAALLPDASRDACLALQAVLVPLLLLHVLVSWAEAALPGQHVVLLSLPGTLLAWALLRTHGPGADRSGSAQPARTA